MYYSKIIENDTINCIDGITVSLFMSGCPHHCKGCFNEPTWNKEYGFQTDVDYLILELQNLILENNVERSFSVLGGEPLVEYNIENTDKIIKNIRKMYPNIIIYLWSGYTIEEIQNMQTFDILKNIDYLIEGRFVEKLADKKLKLRGSSNQHIYKNENENLIDVTEKIQNSDNW